MVPPSAPSKPGSGGCGPIGGDLAVEREAAARHLDQVLPPPLCEGDGAFDGVVAGEVADGRMVTWLVLVLKILRLDGDVTA
jgi:hypothetical protein